MDTYICIYVSGLSSIKLPFTYTNIYVYLFVYVNGSLMHAMYDMLCVTLHISGEARTIGYPCWKKLDLYIMPH